MALFDTGGAIQEPENDPKPTCRGNRSLSATAAASGSTVLTETTASLNTTLFFRGLGVPDLLVRSYPQDASSNYRNHLC